MSACTREKVTFLLIVTVFTCRLLFITV